jgi:hypothetical protein
MPIWRCPHCGTPQAETARCWVCRRSSTACASCRNFRGSVAAQMGFWARRDGGRSGATRSGPAGRLDRTSPTPRGRDAAQRPVPSAAVEDGTSVRRREFVEVATGARWRPSASRWRRQRRRARLRPLPARWTTRRTPVRTRLRPCPHPRCAGLAGRPRGLITRGAEPASHARATCSPAGRVPSLTWSDTCWPSRRTSTVTVCPARTGRAWRRADARR